ncbi:MAG: hypothetical protein ACFB0D_12655 [Phormidesmis sp.]
MTLATFSTSQEAQQAAALLEGYHFELGNHDAPQWVSLWIESYRPAWVRDAVIEALYQGRYKAFSVRQILELWQKRGQPIRHTTHDFEAAVCQAYGGAKLATAVKPAAVQPALQNKPAKQRASLRTHQSLSAISFNLSEQPPIRQQIGKATESPVIQPSAANGQTQQAAFVPKDGNGQSSRRVLIETAETLQAQRQVNGVSYSPGRGIQPFRPALPFSAQTLRLAKQKALAMSEAR